jgi:hypothetical protein
VNTDVERKRLSLWQEFLLDSFKRKNVCAAIRVLQQIFHVAPLPYFDVFIAACLSMLLRTLANLRSRTRRSVAL